MTTVLIVDDEALAIQAIRCSINWKILMWTGCWMPQTAWKRRRSFARNRYRFWSVIWKCLGCPALSCWNG